MRDVKLTWSSIGVCTFKLGIPLGFQPSILTNRTSKVDKLDIEVLINDNILILEITMVHPRLMKI
jgi:hypothetical protein